MPVVAVNDVSLKFKMEQNRADSLKEFCVRWLRHDLRSEDFWALSGVSLEAEKGNVVGIIGHTAREKARCSRWFRAS